MTRILIRWLQRSTVVKRHLILGSMAFLVRYSRSAVTRLTGIAFHNTFGIYSVIVVTDLTTMQLQLLPVSTSSLLPINIKVPVPQQRLGQL